MRRFAGLVAACALGCAAPRGGGPEILLDRDGKAVFRVRGLDPKQLTEDGSRVLSVYVRGAESGVPLFGEYRVEGGDLVFEPRFPLKAGLEYRAVVSGCVERVFSLPEAPPGPATVVRRVFPSRETVPENLLKLYVHFSAPMARGEAYQRVHLLGPDGTKVELPFLELGEELWDRPGTRLTLFFDPGRIKRGLKPREEFGPVLEEGKSYTFVIDPGWRDAAGRPLAQGYRRAFKASTPDDRQPDPKRWKLAPPRAGATEPLTVSFGEPMDEAMLHRSLGVVDGHKKPVAGRVEVDEEETRWRFHPQEAWAAGKYSLGVASVLEDLAGNSIDRPFEVDVVRPLERRVGTTQVTLPFEVTP